MFDINLIRQEPDLVRQSLRNRQMDTSIVDTTLKLDQRRRSLLMEVESLKAERNTVSREIGKMKNPIERQEKIEAMRALGDRIAALDEQVRQVEAELQTTLSGIPNLPDPSVPVGESEHDNVVIKQVGCLLYTSPSPRDS